MFSFFLAFFRNMEPNPLYVGFPIHTSVTMASLAATSAVMRTVSIIRGLLKAGVSINRLKNAINSMIMANMAPE